MAKGSDSILKQLSLFRRGARDIREIILANLAMISEIPSPTFDESARVAFFQQRLSECGLSNCSIDEAGNAVGLMPGERDNNILLVSHADTLFPKSVDHTVTLNPKTVRGPGVADNGLGLAALASMPSLLAHLGIHLESTLGIMATSQSLGRGNLRGLSFFLKNRPLPIRAALCVEGAPLGRLSFSSIGMMRGEIRVVVPDEYDWTRFGQRNAIFALNEVINLINAIRVPRRPRTNIIIGSVRAGASYDTMPTTASLLLEIRSEAAGMVREILQSIRDIAEEVTTRTGANVTVDIFARRRPGGIPFAHPLAKQSRAIMRRLKVKPRIVPSMSELAAFIQYGIPAVTIGLTEAEHIGEPDETIQIEPVFTGMAQLLALMLAIDGGLCDED